MALADPGGHYQCAPPPTESISFVFAYVFAEKCTHWRLAPPPRVGAPPTGNPGSATVWIYFFMFALGMNGVTEILCTHQLAISLLLPLSVNRSGLWTG